MNTNYYYNPISARATKLAINIPKASDVDEDLFFRQILFENLPVTGNDWIERKDTNKQYDEWKSIPHGVDAAGSSVTLAEVAWKLLKKKHDEITGPLVNQRFGFQFNVDGSMMPILVVRQKNYWPIIIQIKTWKTGELTSQYIDDFVSVLESNISQIRLCLKGWNEALLGAWPTSEPSSVKIFGFVFGSTVSLSDDFKNGKYGKYPRFVTDPDYDSILGSGKNGVLELGAEKSPWNLKSGTKILNVDSNFWADPSIDLLNLQSNGENSDYNDRGTFFNTEECTHNHPAFVNDKPFFVTKILTDMKCEEECTKGMWAARHYITINGYEGGTTKEAKRIICHEMMHTLLGVYDTYRIGNCSNFTTVSERDQCETDPARRLTEGRNGPEWFAQIPDGETILHWGLSLTAFDVAYIRMQYKRQIDAYKTHLTGSSIAGVSSALAQNRPNDTPTPTPTPTPTESNKDDTQGVFSVSYNFIVLFVLSLILAIAMPFFLKSRQKEVE